MCYMFCHFSWQLFNQHNIPRLTLLFRVVCVNRFKFWKVLCNTEKNLAKLFVPQRHIYCCLKKLTMFRFGSNWRTLTLNFAAFFTSLGMARAKTIKSGAAREDAMSWCLGLEMETHLNEAEWSMFRAIESSSRNRVEEISIYNTESIYYAAAGRARTERSICWIYGIVWVQFRCVNWALLFHNRICFRISFKIFPF